MSLRKLLSITAACLFFVYSCVGQKEDFDPDSGVETPETPSGGNEEGEAFLRRSLILEFTGTWCVNCPKMENAVQDAQDARPGRLLVISVHCLSADPLSLMPKSTTLTADFGVKAWPSVIVDLDAPSLLTTASSELILAQCDRLLAERQEAAGICIQTSGKNVSVEATTVRDGDYSLHLVLLEDGIIAPQTGGSSSHVHNHVLREWHDSEVFTSRKEGDVLKWSVSVDAEGEAYRMVAFVCRNGIVDNVTSCKLGESVPYHYEDSSL